MLIKQSKIEKIISAGIDIGTSTTKIAISQLSLKNTAGSGQVPKIEITEKQLIYSSPIYKTPILSNTIIDVDAIYTIIQSEYVKAGITYEDIQTGAVIITGETATKQNAEEIVHLLSAAAGEFVVAAAGPDLEGIIAAKGSGAYQCSIDTGKTIANIDIGGGTANIAVYQSGRLCGTCTLHIGGRLLEWEGTELKMSPSIEKWMKEKGFSPSEDCIEEIVEEMANVLARVLDRSFTREDELLILGKRPDWNVQIESLIFSGGVSDCIYHQESLTRSFQDIGTVLAASIKKNMDLSMWEWLIPNETVRATVLGAGTQTTEISGATIEVNEAFLPIRNVPVYQIPFPDEKKLTIPMVRDAISNAINLFDYQQEGRAVGFYLTELPYLKFRDINQIAAAFTKAIQEIPAFNQPLILILEQDYGKSLGQTLRTLNPKQSVICIDQMTVEHGDYIDIGRVLQAGVVPVIVKTLTFHN